MLDAYRARRMSVYGRTSLDGVSADVGARLVRIAELAARGEALERGARRMWARWFQMPGSKDVLVKRAHELRLVGRDLDELEASFPPAPIAPPVPPPAAPEPATEAPIDVRAQLAAVRRAIGGAR